MYDQCAVGITHFHHGDIDHETEWDRPLWVKSYTTYSQGIFPIPFATASLNTVSVSVSAQDGIVALGKAHTRSALSLSSLPKVALETVPIFV